MRVAVCSGAWSSGAVSAEMGTGMCVCMGADH